MRSGLNVIKHRTEVIVKRHYQHDYLVVILLTMFHVALFHLNQHWKTFSVQNHAVKCLAVSIHVLGSVETVVRENCMSHAGRNANEN